MTYEPAPLSAYTTSIKSVRQESCTVTRLQGEEVRLSQNAVMFETFTNKSDTPLYVVLAHREISLACQNIAGEDFDAVFKKSYLCGKNGSAPSVFQSFEAAEAAAADMGSVDAAVFTRDSDSNSNSDEPSPVSSINIECRVVVHEVDPGATIQLDGLMG